MPRRSAKSAARVPGAIVHRPRESHVETLHVFPVVPQRARRFGEAFPRRIGVPRHAGEAHALAVEQQVPVADDELTQAEGVVGAFDRMPLESVNSTVMRYRLGWSRSHRLICFTAIANETSFTPGFNVSGCM